MSSSFAKKVLFGVRQRCKFDLSAHDVARIERESKNIIESIGARQYNEAALLEITIETLTAKFIARMKHDANPVNQFDVHEMLKHEIGSYPQTSNNDIELKSEALTNFFGTREPLALLKMFNPGAAECKAYLVLDRRYTSLVENNTKFTWYVSVGGAGAIGQGFAGTTAPLRDITGFRILPFIFPSTAHAKTSTNRISILMDEFSTQTYNAQANDRKFHFMFGVEYTNPLLPTTSTLSLNDLGRSPTEYKFYKPFFEIRSITLTFGNPMQILTLDPDTLTGTFAPSGALTEITFASNHNQLSGDLIYVTNFTTSSPAQDHAQIAAMTSAFGLTATVVNATQLTVSVDISGLTGLIIGTPSVYFDSKRFVIQLECYFSRSELHKQAM